MISVRLPDGSVKEFADDSTSLDVANSIGSRLAQAVLAAKTNGTVVDSARPLKEVADVSQPVDLKLLTDRDAEALGVLRHSCAHVMARAVMRLFPNVNLAFGPTLANGFYYDIDCPHKISEEDFPRIEEEMRKIVKDAEPFERFILDRKEAREFCDLCRGPHIPDAGRIKAFKLLTVAGSYWKGDAANRQLQRLYGTAFFKKDELEAYLTQVEEAKRRDHRVLGKKLGLFSISNDVGQGLILWMPKGATVRALLEEFIKKELLARGYQPVYSPHIGRVEMYETSGHFPYYRDAQFAPLFGHDAGQLVDFWIRQLTAGTLSAEHEKKLIAAGEVMGAKLDGYLAAASNEEKIQSLRRWE